MIKKCLNCGKEFKNIDKRRKYCSISCGKISLISNRIGKDNPNWKGDNVGYASLHGYIKRYLPKQGYCNDCKIITTKLDLANISQEYKRDIKDWEWLCRKCHMTKDNRLSVFKTNGYQKGQVYSENQTGDNINCIVCNKLFYRQRHENKKCCSSKCSNQFIKLKFYNKNKELINKSFLLQSQGLNHRAIAINLNLSPSTVYHWLKHYKTLCKQSALRANNQ